MYQEVEKIICGSFLLAVAVVFYSLCKVVNIFCLKHRLVLVSYIHQKKVCTIYLFLSFLYFIYILQHLGYINKVKKKIFPVSFQDDFFSA